MSMWDARELERWTAARVAGMGFIPALNVVHSETQSEFDVYAFLPEESGFERLMVQCTVTTPDADKLRALKTCGQDFGADHWVFVTSTKPHDNQMAMADWHDIELLSESPHAQKHACTITGRTLDVRCPVSHREEAICWFLRGIAWLRRVALEHRNASPEADQVVQTWNALDEVFLTPDPFRRLQDLYDIHNDEPELSQKCAGAEGLADSAYDALWNAMVLGDGKYTQSALAAQTINRVHTLITFAECACRVAEGEAVPDYLDDPRGRRGKLIRDLAERRARSAFAVVAFEFIYGWGGLWRAEADSIDADLARLAAVTAKEVAEARTRIDRLLRAEGMGEFIKSFSPKYATWECFALLPYFAKGVGVRRFNAEMNANLGGKPYGKWTASSVGHERACERYERAH